MTLFQEIEEKPGRRHFSYKAKTEEIQETLGIGEADRSKSKWKRGIYAAFFIAILATAWWGWRRLSMTEIPMYVTEEVTRGNLILMVTATGNLQAVNTVEVGSEISGLIKSVFVDYNDRVTEGQLLARLDTERLEAEVAQANAALAASEASLTQALASLEEQRQKTQRAEQLAGRELISNQELETARAALTRNEATVSSARAQVVLNRAALNMAETNLSKASIRSPINGLVLTSDIKPGQAVAASFQTPVLFTLAEDLSHMELHVDEADISQVREGQLATFTVDAYPDSTFPAVITKVYYAPQTVSGVVTYKAILSVDNPNMLLRPGLTATTEIITQQVEDALLVPNSALRFTPPGENRENQEGDVVWVMRDNQPEPLQLETGLSDNQQTQVLSGDLQPGEALLVNIQRE